jgi:hypothetical protein
VASCRGPGDVCVTSGRDPEPVSGTASALGASAFVRKRDAKRFLQQATRVRRRVPSSRPPTAPTCASSTQPLSGDRLFPLRQNLCQSFRSQALEGEQGREAAFRWRKAGGVAGRGTRCAPPSHGHSTGVSALTSPHPCNATVGQTDCRPTFLILIKSFTQERAAGHQHERLCRFEQHCAGNGGSSRPKLAVSAGAAACGRQIARWVSFSLWVHHFKGYKSLLSPL